MKFRTIAIFSLLLGASIGWVGNDFKRHVALVQSKASACDKTECFNMVDEMVKMEKMKLPTR